MQYLNENIGNILFKIITQTLNGEQEREGTERNAIGHHCQCSVQFRFSLDNFLESKSNR